MKKESWKSTGSAVYNLNYHFVWSTKYRRRVLNESIGATLKESII
ncbi:transposase, partial [Polycladomyces subterraneus]